MAIEASDNLADLGWIRNDGDHRHAASAARASQDVYRVDLGKQPRPGSTAAERVDLSILRCIGKRRLCRCRAAVPAGRHTSTQRRTILPGSATSGGVQPVAAYKMAPAGRAPVTLRVTAARGNVRRHRGDEVQRGVVADPALEEPRGGSGPGDGILPFVTADALEGKRCSHEILAQRLARGLVEDAGPTFDREARVLPGENLAGEVGIQQTLLEEQGDDA